MFVSDLYMLLQFEEVQTVYADEAFILMVDIRCSSSWTVEFQTSCVALVSNRAGSH